MKRIILLLLCLFLSFSVSACSSKDSNSVSDITGPTCTVKTSTETISGENFDLSVVTIEGSNSFTNALNIEYKASEGNTLLLIVLAARNKTDETKNVGPCFVSSCDGKSVSVVSAAGKINGYMPFVGAVAPNTIFEAYQIWELPEDWTTFKLSYLDAQTGSESETMQINRSDINK